MGAVREGRGNAVHTALAGTAFLPSHSENSISAASRKAGKKRGSPEIQTSPFSLSRSLNRSSGASYGAIGGMRGQSQRDDRGHAGVIDER